MIRSYLNKITMYRLMLYYLVVLFFSATLLSAIGILPYNALDIATLGLYLCLICYGSNWLLAKLFKTHPNLESQFITALILTLIVGPIPLESNLLFITSLGLIGMASKYFLAWRGKHIFNPAALAAVAAAIFLGQGASWWIGSLTMFPIIVVGGLLILQKTRRHHLVIAFLITYFALYVIQSILSDNAVGDIWRTIPPLLSSSPLLFFSLVMLVEPLTSPTTRDYRLYFGAIIAFAYFMIPLVFPNIGYALELSLLIGNVFTRVMSRDSRLVLTLDQKLELAPNIINFAFKPSRSLEFKAGQYLEYTLPHVQPDNRGIRRFFTIAASPTEEIIALTTRFASEKPSTFKQALRKMKVGDTISATDVAGDFTLPEDQNRHLVFIAGGIGITPFRSMIRYLLDTKQKPPITLMYSNRTPKDILFTDLWSAADEAIDLRTILTLTDPPPKGWEGKTGYIDAAMIQEEIPDYKEALFYVSGPEPMVVAFAKMLSKMGVKNSSIKRDYFPGYSDTK